MKSLLLFDVDGTLVVSGQNVQFPLTSIIQTLKQQYDIGIVGGGKHDKILEQLGYLRFNHYFSECGCVYHENVSNIPQDIKFVKHYSKNLRKHELYPKINDLVKQSLHFLSQVDYTITGNFVDLRNGIIYISLIGMTATQDERTEFIGLDAKHGYRSQLLELLNATSAEMNMSDKIHICEGGRVGIAIYPTEYDKVQVLEHLTDKYQDIHYFGDKYNENGNDYNIINNKRVIGHKVDNVNDTIEILSKML